MLASAAVPADGSIPPLTFGVDVEQDVTLVIVDGAGNETSQALFNDLTPPVVSDVTVSPAWQSHGGEVVIEFDVTDDHSDLSELPVVNVVGGRLAADDDAAGCGRGRRR